MAPRYEARVLPSVEAIIVESGTAVTLPQATAGVHANATGLLTCRFAGGSADVTLSVVSGQTYPFSIVSVPLGNAVQIVALFN